MGRIRRFFSSSGRRVLAAAAALGVVGTLALPGLALADPGDPPLDLATPGSISGTPNLGSYLTLTEPTWQDEAGDPVAAVVSAASGYQWIGEVSGSLGVMDPYDGTITEELYLEGSARLQVTFSATGFSDTVWLSDPVTFVPMAPYWSSLDAPVIPAIALVGATIAPSYDGMWSHSEPEIRSEWWQVDCATPSVGSMIPGATSGTLVVPSGLTEDCLQFRSFASLLGYEEVGHSSNTAVVQIPGSLQIHAVDAQGLDAAGYELRLAGAETATSAYQADFTTDAGGEVEVPGLAPGAYRITFADWDASSGYHPDFGALGAPRASWVDVVVDSDGTTVVLPVRRNPGVAGQVLDEHGTPLPGDVDVHLAADSTSYTQVESGDDGSFEILRNQLDNPPVRLRWLPDAGRCAVSGPVLQSRDLTPGATFTLDHHIVERDLVVSFLASRPTVGTWNDAEQQPYPATLNAPTPGWDCVDGDTEYAYQWYRDGEEIDGADASSYATLATDVGSDLSVEIVASNATGYPRTYVSLPVEITGGPAPLNTASPTIVEVGGSGGLLPGDIVTVDLGTWNPSDVELESVSWRLFNSFASYELDEIVGTGETLVLDRGMVGPHLVLEATVTVSSPGREDGVALTPLATVSPLPTPTLASTPSIVGDAEPGGTISVSGIVWSPADGVGTEFQWRVSDACGIVSGSFGSVGASLDIPADYTGAAITVSFWPAGQGYVYDPPNSFSSLCVEMPEPAPAPTVVPSIAPERAAPDEDLYLPGDTVELDLGEWPVPVTVESVSWRVFGPYEDSRDEVVGSGQTLLLDRSMVATDADPLRIEATIVVSSPGHTDAVVTTPAITVSPLPAPVLTSTPAIDGTAAPGNYITVTNLEWSPSDGVEGYFEWFNSPECGVTDGYAQPGVGPAFDIPDDYSYAAITVLIHASGEGYAVDSDPAELCVDVVHPGDQPDVITPPAVVGDPWVGETLTVEPGTWEASDGTILLWQYWNSTNWVMFATGDSLEVDASYYGSVIRVLEINQLDGFTDASAPAASVTIVDGTQSAPAPPPSIGGTVKVDEALSAVPGGWAASSGSTFVWLVGADAGSLVEVATGTSFVPEAGQAGQLLVLREENARPYYLARTAESAPVVIGLGDAPSSGFPMSVSGSGAVGGSVTASTGSWPLGTDVSCSWLRDGVPTGETGASYTVVGDDFGAEITCRVRAEIEGYQPAVVDIAPGIEIVTPGPAAIATVAPVIVGTPRAGTTLGVTTGTWDAAGLQYSAAWSIGGGAPIVQPTLTLTSAHVGQTVTVTVTASRFGYADGVADAVAVGPVSAAPAPPAGGPDGGSTDDEGTDDEDTGEEDPGTEDPGTEQAGEESEGSGDGSGGATGAGSGDGAAIGEPSGAGDGGLPPGAVIALVGGGVVVLGGAGAAGWIFLRPKP